MRSLKSQAWTSAVCVTQAETDRRRDALCAHGFRPAFFDYATCTLHPSRHADGRPAEVHVLDGLPEAMVVVRTDCGRVIAVKATLMVGFERDGFFFTPTAAWRAAREWGYAA
jgi:hypothetical protein